MAKNNQEAPSSFRLLMGLALAESICVSAFIFELLRAFSGNGLSWAYVFEWPLFGGYAIYLWRRLSGQEARQWRPRSASRSNRRALEDDAALERWNHYLEELHNQKSQKKDLS